MVVILSPTPDGEYIARFVTDVVSGNHCAKNNRFKSGLQNLQEDLRRPQSIRSQLGFETRLKKSV